MPTTREQLQHWLDEPDGSHFEFKEVKRNFHFEKLVEYCVALANEGGGKILLGVTDLRPDCNHEPRQHCNQIAYGCNERVMPCERG